MESPGAQWDPEFGDDAGTRLVQRPYLYMNKGIATWQLEPHRELHSGFMVLAVQRGREEERR
jgi:hypothetical protein